MEQQTGKPGKRFDVHPTVFFTSAGLILLFVALTLLSLETAESTFNQLKSTVTHYAGWFFTGVVNIYLLFVVYLAFSKLGKIRLGGKDAKPEFGRLSWFAMLFSAGMGIGLIFYSVAEPMYHLAAPPFPGADAMSPAAAEQAMLLTYFHWGLHAWGIYALVGLALAFFCYNKGQPLTIRSAFYPLMGERIHGAWGNAIDILAVVATLFGVATSLGIGVQQVNGGLYYLFDIPINTTTQVALIAAITALATVSVVTGVDKGIRRLSEFNLLLALGLLLFVLILGPTLFNLNGLMQNTGRYLQNFARLSFWTETYRDNDWQDSWTIFYWAWWIAWSPFVGMFIARISKGRTIQEFILGVLIVPTAATFIWLSTFGNAAIHTVLNGNTELITTVVEQGMPEVALFELIKHYPLASLASMVSVVVIITFFVTSSDSGSLVIDIITAGGNLNPPVTQRIFWALMEGAVAAVLLLGGGLTALQTGSITMGLPFALVLLLMCYSLYKGLRESV